MKVVLLSPRIPPAPMNFAGAMDLVGCAFSHIPLPLATLAALTPRTHAVRILDENVEEVPLDLDADLVAFTGIWCQRDRLFELADGFRARGVRVAIGGPIAQDAEDECRQHADVLFVGEAEYTWPRYFSDCDAGRALAVYRQEEAVDMADSPMPRFDLLRVERYSSACVQATRGCPYRCEYCDVPRRYGTRPRSKPVERVVAEVQELARLGFDSIFFVDDHFAGNRKYARELLRALEALQRRLPAPLYFYTQLTLNVAADEELLDRFFAAGFRRFFIGIETPDPAKLRAMDKPQNLELDVRAAITRIQEHGITVWAGLMLGLDGDDERTADEMFRFVQETAITPTLIGLLQAMPRTPLFDRAVREERLLPVVGIVGSGAFGALDTQAVTNLMPRGIGVTALLDSFGSLVRRVFDADAYGTRVIAATSRARVRSPSLWRSLHRRNLATILRATRYFLFEADRDSRRLFFRIMKEIAVRRGIGGEELFYHLVIYKHLREFYSAAATHVAVAARDRAVMESAA